MSGVQIRDTWTVSGPQLAGTAVALLCALPLVRILIHGIGLDIGTIPLVVLLVALGWLARWMVQRDKRLPAAGGAGVDRGPVS